jgi:hypothetical protein
MKKLFVSFLLFGGICLATDSIAQYNRRAIRKNNKRIATYVGKKHFGKEHIYSGFGFSLSALNYYGDLSPLPNKFSTDISFTKPALAISYSHRLGPRYTLMGQFMYGTLQGSDAESAKKSGSESFNFNEVRNLSFRNRIKELSVVAYLDLFKNVGTYISRVKWTPYLFGGVAVFFHNPQAQAPKFYLDGTPDPKAGQWVDLQPLGTEGQNPNTSTLQSEDINYGIKKYSLTQVAIPFGGGARFKINEVFDLWADIGFRYTFTDYLDDVSANYVDVTRFKDPLAQALSYRSNEIPNPGLPTTPTVINGVTVPIINGYGQEYPTNKRGNKKSNDVYMVTSIRVTYILGATFHKANFR